MFLLVFHFLDLLSDDFIKSYTSTLPSAKIQKLDRPLIYGYIRTYINAYYKNLKCLSIFTKSIYPNNNPVKFLLIYGMDEWQGEKLYDPVCHDKEVEFFFLINLFIYFWLCWVFVSVGGLSLVAVSGGHSSLRCAGLSLSWPRRLNFKSSGTYFQA